MSELEKFVKAWSTANNCGQLQAYCEIFGAARAWNDMGCEQDPEEILSDWGLEADFVLVFIDVAGQVEELDSKFGEF